MTRRYNQRYDKILKIKDEEREVGGDGEEV